MKNSIYGLKKREEGKARRAKREKEKGSGIEKEK